MALPKTLEQGRAAAAYKFAFDGKQSLKKYDEYKSYVKKIPMLIKTNGLGATLAFVKSKGGETYSLIFKQTHDWLSKKELFNFTTEDNFLKELVSLDSDKYRAVTVEVLSLFTWLRRFAEGLSKD